MQAKTPHLKPSEKGNRIIKANYLCKNCGITLEFGNAKMRVRNGSVEYYCRECFKKLFPRKC